MSLMKLVNFKKATFFPYFNTRTPIDIAVGQYLRGANNDWVLDGGAGPVNGLVARSGYFKSTTVDNMVTNMLEIYPDSEYYKMDTENTSTSLERFHKLSGGRIDVDNRIFLTNKGEYNVKEYMQLQQNIGEAKVKHRKDYEVETPFLDQNTGKPLRMLLPTFMSLDSISNLSTDKNVDMFESDIEDKKTNTADMYDGKIKKRLVDSLITWAYKYNFVYFITAHVGETFNIDPSKPSPKQNQWMSTNDKITGAGKNFLFLPNLVFQLNRPRPLVDDKKMPLYPTGNTVSSRESIEINRLDLKVLRGKNNITGTIIPTVLSQHYGILADLSYYEYLRELDKGIRSGQVGESGFELKGYNRYSPLLPDTSYARKTIRQLCTDDYRARRTLEIMFQFHWFTRYWNCSNYEYHIPATLEELVNEIHKSSSIMIDDILESRGYWTYNKSEKRKYMSILDIIELINIKDKSISKQVPDDLQKDKDLERQMLKDIETSSAE